MAYHMRYSEKLQLLHLVGIRIREDGWRGLAYGAEHSNTLKRFIIHNCNLAEGKFMEVLSRGLEKSKHLEYLDLQCNDLDDSHAPSLARIIKE